MNIRKQLDAIMSREMDRKHFLQYAALSILSFIGIGGFLKAFIASEQKAKEPPKTNGYGASRFGQ